MKTTRKIGKELELLISSYLKKHDKYARPTKASGGSTELHDILSKEYAIECKVRNSENATIKKKVWDKLCREIPVGSFKIPILALQNKHQDTWIVLQCSDFFNILTKLNEKKEN